MGERIERLGSWELQFSEEAVVLDEDQVRDMEAFLNERWLPLVRRSYQATYRPNLALARWGIPSLLIRLDMPPYLNGTPFGVYEVEANPSGYGVTMIAGVSLAPPIVDALKALGISQLGYGTAPSREDQAADLDVFAASLAREGMTLEKVQLGFKTEMPEDIPLWLRAGEEDAPLLFRVLAQCVLLHQDGGGNKEYLLHLGAHSLAECDPWEIFPQGFAIKPFGGWGSREVELYSADQPWKRRSSTATRVQRVIAELRASGRAGQFLVQPFLPPQVQDKAFRIWRVFAVWTPAGYKVIGGTWNQRGYVKVHGANDTLYGPIFAP